MPMANKGVKLLIISDDSISKETFVKEYDEVENLSMLTTKKSFMRFGTGSFHPKTWFIEFDDCLRVVIGSANLYINDWSVWSNNLWIRDFPLRKKADPIGYKDVDERQNNFEGYLKFYYKRISNGVPKFYDLVDLDKYDFSNPKDDLPYLLASCNGN